MSSCRNTRTPSPRMHTSSSSWRAAASWFPASPRIATCQIAQRLPPNGMQLDSCRLRVVMHCLMFHCFIATPEPTRLRKTALATFCLSTLPFNSSARANYLLQFGKFARLTSCNITNLTLFPSALSMPRAKR